jgi:16S rRNA (guanine527-N7)-methyltransferase
MTSAKQTLSKLGLSTEQYDNIGVFSSLFLKWNTRINLSAARTPDEVEQHVVDSLHVVRFLEGAQQVVDVGSGGGFPVVVAAIVCPTIGFTAIEPVHKKHAFLRTAARELGLVNLDALAIRIEDHERHDYDIATSRATFDLGAWLAMGLGIVRPGGAVLGFEAVVRDDLGVDVERFPYELGDKQRAIVRARRAGPQT